MDALRRFGLQQGPNDPASEGSHSRRDNCWQVRSNRCRTAPRQAPIVGRPTATTVPRASAGWAAVICETVPVSEAATATTEPPSEALLPTGHLRRFEPLVCRALCVTPSSSAPAGRTRRADDAVTHRLFNFSIALSAIRCLLSYVVLPIIVPAIGGAASVPPSVGLPIAVVALVFDVIAVRRFWASSHPWRWPITFVYAVVMSLVLALLVGDIIGLVS